MLLPVIKTNNKTKQCNPLQNPYEYELANLELYNIEMMHTNNVCEITNHTPPVCVSYMVQENAESDLF